MTTLEQIPPARLGEVGEPCATCGTPLDVDQRYCLECGARRGDPRLPYEQFMPGAPAPSADAAGDGSGPPASAPPERRSEPSPLGAVIGVALLGTMLLLGVLLGRGGDDPAPAPAPIVQVGDAATTADAGGGGAAETVAATKVTSEWPEGKDGWTIELGTLPKQGTVTADVEATKSDLADQGAADLGVLDSDLYASLPAGNFIVYSGVFDSKADASAALKKLGSGFPDAQVVEVSSQAAAGSGSGSGGGELLSGGGGGGGAGAPGDTVEASSQDLQALENTTGDDYQEQIDNIPDTVATPGQAAPDDPSVEPGGDASGDVQVIK